MKQSEWETTVGASNLEKQPTLQHADTADVQDIYTLKHLESSVIQSGIKAPNEIIREIKTWLRTGVTPDGTRMMTEESWKWKQDIYHVTSTSDKNHENFPENVHADYYYWSCPYVSHIGEIKLIMMEAKVNFPDGTHIPADRLQKKIKRMKNLSVLSKKRREVEEREKKAFIDKHMDRGAHRGHPLRKQGIYTKYFWRPPAEDNSSSEVPAAESSPIPLEPSVSMRSSNF